MDLKFCAVVGVGYMFNIGIVRFFENFQNFGFYGLFYSLKNKKDVFEILGIKITKYQNSEIAIL